MRENFTGRPPDAPRKRRDAGALKRLAAALLLWPPTPSPPMRPPASHESCAGPAAECPAAWLCDGEYFRAQVVFVGRVTRAEPPRGRARRMPARRRGVSEPRGRARVSFAVERAYSGLRRGDDSVQVWAAPGAGAEGGGFKVGQTYLVYARAGYALKSLDYGSFEVISDGRTRPAADAAAEIDCIEERMSRRAPGASHAVVLSGRAVSKPKPAYPAEAKRAGASGTVAVRLTIDETGAVIGAEVLCGNPLLTEAAREAALGARFSPTLIGGRPAKVQTVVSYNFVLN